MRILSPFVSLVCLIITATAQSAYAGNKPAYVSHVRSVYVNTDWQDPLVGRTPNLGNFYWMPQSGETDTMHSASSRARAAIGTSRTKPQAIHAPLPQPVSATTTAKRTIRTSTSIAATYKRNTDSTAVALSYSSPASDAVVNAQLLSTPAATFDSGSSHARVQVKGEVVTATSKKPVQPLKASALKLQ